MGCPIDAKQSALITYVPDAIAAGADLYTDCRARLVETEYRRARAVVIDPLDRASDRPTGRRMVLHAKRGVVLAGGAINTPALLLALARRQRQRPGRPAHVPAPDGAAGRALPRDASKGSTARRSRSPATTSAIAAFASATSSRPRRFTRCWRRWRSPASAPTTARPWSAWPTRRRPSRCSSTASTTTPAAASASAPTGGSRCPIRWAMRTARPPSTPSPTWRACSWRPAPPRSGPCTTSRS